MIDYTIWVGTLGEVEEWIENTSGHDKCIIIIDDIHKYRNTLTNKELHDKALRIVDKVAALIVTCQIDPMDGEVWEEYPELTEYGAEIFDCGFFPSTDDDKRNMNEEFINDLLRKTKCIDFDNINGALTTVATEI